MKANIRVAIAVVVLGLVLSTVGWADLPPVDGGKDAANAWLSLVDGKDYGKAWQDAAGYFRSDVSQDKWIEMMKSGRESLGPVVERKLLSLPAFRRTIPGAPEGEYVVVEYDTTFQNKGAVVEKVTVVKEADGVWRVSAYIFGY